MPGKRIPAHRHLLLFWLANGDLRCDHARKTWHDCGLRVGAQSDCAGSACSFGHTGSSVRRSGGHALGCGHGLVDKGIIWTGVAATSAKLLLLRATIFSCHRSSSPDNGAKSIRNTHGSSYVNILIHQFFVRLVTAGQPEGIRQHGFSLLHASDYI
jgi:hypothetical protein